jgi:hypothetical protein
MLLVAGRREVTLECLNVARLRGADRLEAYNILCKRYSAKAVDAMYQSLVHRGYMECGVSARTGWLTGKGWLELKFPSDQMTSAVDDVFSDGTRSAPLQEESPNEAAPDRGAESGREY